jgi:hypothetical protein
MFYFVILINWRNKFSNYIIFTLKIYWTFYSFYWSFWSILLCKINHFTEHILLANLFLKYWAFYPKYLAFNIVSKSIIVIDILLSNKTRKKTTLCFYEVEIRLFRKNNHNYNKNKIDRTKHGIQDYLEWKRTMKSLPFSIFKVTGLNFLWHQYGIAL